MKDKDTKLLEEAYGEIYNPNAHQMQGISLLQLINNELKSPVYKDVDYENDYTEESGKLEGMLMVKDMLEEYDPDDTESPEILQKILNIISNKEEAIADRMKVYGSRHIDNMSQRMIGRATAFNEVKSWIKTPQNIKRNKL